MEFVFQIANKINIFQEELVSIVRLNVQNVSKLLIIASNVKVEW
jgi:archaellum component FlaC